MSLPATVERQPVARRCRSLFASAAAQMRQGPPGRERRHIGQLPFLPAGKRLDRCTDRREDRIAAVGRDQHIEIVAEPDPYGQEATPAIARSI